MHLGTTAGREDLGMKECDNGVSGLFRRPERKIWPPLMNTFITLYMDGYVGKQKQSQKEPLIL
jgi:hypothetical protein